MKILHVIRVDSIGGAEKTLLYGLPALRDVGVYVEVALLDPLSSSNPMLRELQQLNIPYTRFEDQGKVNPNMAWKIAKKCRNEGFELLHVHGYRAVFYGLVASRLAGIPICVTRHGLLSRHWKERLVEQLELQISNQFDLVIGVAEHLLERVEAPAVLLPNGMFIPTEQDCRVLPDFPEKFLFVGRLSDEKNPFLLVEIWKELKRQGMSFSLDIIGDGHLYEKLESAVVEAGVSDLVTLHGFQKTTPFYQQSDCLLMTSLREGLPLVALEAMSYGLPVISTKVGFLPSLLDSEGERCGLLVEEGLDAYVQAIKNISKQGFGRELGQVGRKKVMKDFSINSWAQKQVQYYHDMLNKQTEV